MKNVTWNISELNGKKHFLPNLTNEMKKNRYFVCLKLKEKGRIYYN